MGSVGRPEKKGRGLKADEATGDDVGPLRGNTNRADRSTTGQCFNVWALKRVSFRNIAIQCGYWTLDIGRHWTSHPTPDGAES